MSTPATVHAPAEKTLRVSLPKVTIAMLFCGIVSAAGIGAASAAVSDEDVPSVVVKFRPGESARRTREHARCTARSSSPPSRCARQSIGSAVQNPAVLQMPRTIDHAGGDEDQQLEARRDSRERVEKRLSVAAANLAPERTLDQREVGCDFTAAWRSTPPRISRMRGLDPGPADHAHPLARLEILVMLERNAESA